MVVFPNELGFDGICDALIYLKVSDHQVAIEDSVHDWNGYRLFFLNCFEVLDLWVAILLYPLGVVGLFADFEEGHVALYRVAELFDVIVNFVLVRVTVFLMVEYVGVARLHHQPIGV